MTQGIFEAVTTPRTYYVVSPKRAVGEPVCIPAEGVFTTRELEETARRFVQAFVQTTRPSDAFMHGMIKELRRISGK